MKIVVLEGNPNKDGSSKSIGGTLYMRGRRYKDKRHKQQKAGIKSDTGFIVFVT